MYNSELKNRFISEREKEVTYANNYLNALFDRTELTENKYEKDLSNFTYYEIIDLFKAMSCSSIRAVSQYKSIFMKYTYWCLEQGLVVDGQNHFEELYPEVYSECVNKLVAENNFITPERMNRWLAQIENASDGAMLLGIYEGLDSPDFKDLSELKLSDIDMENRIAHLQSGRSPTISARLLTYLVEANAETVLQYEGAKKVSYRTLLNDGTIFHRLLGRKENVQTDAIKRDWLETRVQRYIRIKLEGYRITRKKIVYSGKVNFINKRSKELGISTAVYCKQYLDEINNQYGNTDNSYFFFREYGEYLD